MSARYQQKIRFVLLKEFILAKKARGAGHYQQEFNHLENAHVLGQHSTYWHSKAHCLMLLWAVRRSAKKEFAGQLLRIFGALTKTAIGLVPAGNTGGSNISPFKSLPLSTQHAKAIARAQS